MTLVRGTERQFQQQVEQLARFYGWRSYHTFDSRRSAKGFPDLVMVRPPELLIVELKTDQGRLSVEQREWIADLTTVADTIARGAGWQPDTNLLDVYVWRPADFEVLHARLARGRRMEQAA